jgi:hypothetical protein
MMSLLDSSGMTGDIWSTGAFAIESPMKDILDSGNFTMEQLLAEDELLQELRGLHPQLLDYFATEEAVASLIQYLILDPKSPPRAPTLNGAGNEDDVKEEGKRDEDEEKRPEPGKWLFQHLEDNKSTDVKNQSPESNPDNLFIRFPYMACEIICCEMQGVINVIVDGYVPTTVTKASGRKANVEKPQQHANEGEAEASLGEAPNSEHNHTRQRLLDLLFSVLYETPQGDLDDYRAGYLEKTLSVLFRLRPRALSEYINAGGGKGGATLMKAMFKHLYSHSIMQLVQRLLLPQPPQMRRQNPEFPPDKDGEDDGNLILSAPEMEAMAAAGGFLVEEADDESKTLQCKWSESEESLDLLLMPLIYPYDDHAKKENGSANGSSLSEEEQERRLNMAQNSSEVLITIIQNSPLNSPTMLKLTVDPIIEKLVNGASSLHDGEDFSPHESTLTATMNVLESLVLQLGGYGSVGTISLLPTDEEGDENGDEASEQPSTPPPPQFADLKFLLTHIPRLLRSLSALLQHPACDTWKSPMQFSKTSEPVLLLGMSRLRIVRLLESLVLLGESNVDALLCQSDCLEICLNLFWKFQWCSMLHQSVANLLVHVFEGANTRSKMQEYFLVKCNLLGRLMDSFAEVVPSDHGFSLRDCAPMPDFAEQELVISMKNVKVGVEGSDTKAPETKDMGSSEDKQRVLAEDTMQVSDDDVDIVLEKQVEQQEAFDTSTSSMADLAEGDAFKEPDVHQDASISVGQISTEAVRFESRDASTVGATHEGAPAQSFRLGYMGHVIIICQALVHACSAESDEDLEPTAPDSVIGEDDDRRSLLADAQQEEAIKMNGEGPYDECEGVMWVQSNEVADSQTGDLPAGRDDGESGRAVDSNVEGIPPPNPLMLSKLIESHRLRSRWQDFVKSTLATETAIQSTPLGGFNNNPLPGGDPLHAHRPLGDADDFDDGSGQPNMPPRGMLGGGDVIDMDDNDLDIAASMMAGLHLARGRRRDEDDDDNDSSDDEESDGSGQTYDSGEHSAKKGYFFDDPLGGRNSGLGLALGNLGQYHANGSDDEDDSDKGSDHSSEDDESPSQPRRTTSSGDVPVMNLFAGNLPPGTEENPAQAESPFDDNVWSNFANFDAFDNADGFAADFGSADINDPTSDPFPPLSSGVDDIFGGPATHAILLDDPAEPDSTVRSDQDPFVVNTNTRPGKGGESPDGLFEERPEASLS